MHKQTTKLLHSWLWCYEREHDNLQLQFQTEWRKAGYTCRHTSEIRQTCYCYVGQRSGTYITDQLLTQGHPGLQHVHATVSSSRKWLTYAVVTTASWYIRCTSVEWPHSSMARAFVIAFSELCGTTSSNCRRRFRGFTDTTILCVAFHCTLLLSSQAFFFFIPIVENFPFSVY